MGKAGALCRGSVPGHGVGALRVLTRALSVGAVVEFPAAAVSQSVRQAVDGIIASHISGDVFGRPWDGMIGWSFG